MLCATFIDEPGGSWTIFAAPSFVCHPSSQPAVKVISPAVEVIPPAVEVIQRRLYLGESAVTRCRRRTGLAGVGEDVEGVGAQR